VTKEFSINLALGSMAFDDGPLISPFSFFRRIYPVAADYRYLR